MNNDMNKDKQERRMVGSLFIEHRDSIKEKVEETGESNVSVGKSEHKITKENYYDYFPKGVDYGKQIHLNKLDSEPIEGFPLSEGVNVGRNEVEEEPLTTLTQPEMLESLSRRDALTQERLDLIDKRIDYLQETLDIIMKKEYGLARDGNAV
jgi:hypothetical protein